jgi:molecular chaperone DnaK
VVVATDETGLEKRVAHLIRGNTPLPHAVTETRFGTLLANQRGVEIDVREQGGQTESELLENNTFIGGGEITGLPPNLAKGSPIHITFKLEEDGTLTVSAVEPSSGRNLFVEIKTKGVMSQEEVEERKSGLLVKTVS